ncbi:hypothetical protein BJ165DRAFT_1074682 [Panaeolus papilionaceus]|nr:hypothetical protein BJ165DRAFT_1074682 [Panaeolus papilionaceus]
MSSDLRQRQRRRGLGSGDLDDLPRPPTVNHAEPLLSAANELRTNIDMAIRDSALSEVSHLQLQNELKAMLQKLQSSPDENVPPPLQHNPPHPAPVSSANNGAMSNAAGPSKLAIFGGQVTFVNTVHNGDDAERAKNSEQLQQVLRMQYIQTTVFLSAWTTTWFVTQQHA